MITFPEEIRINNSYANIFGVESKNELKDTTPVTKRKTITSTEFMKRLKDYVDPLGSSHIMPPNCRYIEKLSRGCVVIIEEPPALRTVSYQNFDFSQELDDLKMKNIPMLDKYTKSLSVATNERKLTLAVPYSVFVLYISNYFELLEGYFFFTPRQMTGLSDILYKSPFPNIGDDCQVCFGDKVNKRCRSLIDAVQHAIMVFWSAKFNTDLSSNYRRYRKVPYVGNLFEWDYLSQTNPMFVYSVDWMQYKNVKTIIDRIKDRDEEYTGRSSFRYDYKLLSDVFYTTQESDKEVQVGKIKKKLYYDITQTVYLTDHIYLTVGDYLVLNKRKIAFVDSFVGFADGGDVEYIILDCEGKKFTLKYNDNCIEFLIDQIKSQRELDSITLKNGNVLKSGDIIILNINGTQYYKKIDYIRKCRHDNNIGEIKVGSAYFLSDAIDAEVFDENNITISGIQIKKNTEYVLIEKNRDSLLCYGDIITFEKMEEDSGRIALIFKSQKMSNKSEILGEYLKIIDLNSLNSYDIIPKENIKLINNTFIKDNKLYDAAYGSNTSINSVFLYQDKIYYDRSNINIRKVERGNSDNIISSILKDDELYIPGIEFDINFKIGEKVVVANWQNPIDVLNIKTINGFKYDSDNKKLYFILTDKFNTITEELFIDFSISFIKVGYIRKVTTEYDKLKIGCKIKAKNIGIQNFPKKDVNIVVAIIIDSPFEPLALCSNGCTLWYSTVINDFEIIEMTSKKWSKLEHVPLDVSKIKLQPGDLVKGLTYYNNIYNYMVYFGSPLLRCSYLNEFDIEYNSVYNIDNTMSSDLILDCIPNPRLSQKVQSAMSKKYGYYDLYGRPIEGKVNNTLILIKEENKSE